ncbi:hypothetical protein E4U42_000590 [Claviceps africana]|uniref:Carbohydrate kinase PfkB domain-containing protein n=1 Tax=Claviceps africana TaxID=83212 RepID=A0A8K0JG19_9HYPO|nr:hypothetical protein E4U42_000590 [Claviceps africana]
MPSLGDHGNKDEVAAKAHGNGADEPEMDFVTLGMVIIDDIEYAPPTPSVSDVLGGAGTYATLGARLLSPPPLSRSIGWVVDKGSDFPNHISVTIDSWRTAAVIREDRGRLTTRGWNCYAGPTGRRLFRYQTPKRRLTADDLTPDLLRSKSFHLICSATRCQELIMEITSRRKDAMPRDRIHVQPLFIWEPVPDLCVPDELSNCLDALRLVDVCSPNHAELAGFMGDDDDDVDPETGEVSTRSVERACDKILAGMPLHSYALVIRAGEKGCYIARNGGRKRGGNFGNPTEKREAYIPGGLQPGSDMEARFAGVPQDDDGAAAREESKSDPGIRRWVPAYHQDKLKVVDVTGGGNAFLGGLSVGLARGKKLEDAVAWGSIAASFAIEQVGMPHLQNDVDGVETWNGEQVSKRLERFKV